MLKKQNGITLIALIITIIVMLILVGVTINVALNGGLFSKAETATEGTQKAVEEEQLMTAIVTAYDAKTGVVDKATLQTELEKQGTWTVSGEEGGPYGVTSPKGNAYTVTKDGKIAEGWVDNGDGSYTKGDTTVTVGQTTYTNAEVLEKLGITQSSGTYTGTWTVIGVEGDKIKLVSTANVASSVKLGYNDPGAIEAIAAADESAPTDAEKLERSIWSYKNAVSTLNTAAKDATGIASAESITVEDVEELAGIQDSDKGTTYGKVYNYYYDTTNSRVYSKYITGTDEEGNATWSTGYNTSYETQTFVNEDGETVVVDSEGDEVTLTYNFYSYTLTEEQKAAVGSLATGHYWLTLPCVYCDSDGASFDVLCMYIDSLSGYDGLFYSGGDASDYSIGVRAVVSI